MWTLQDPLLSKLSNRRAHQPGGGSAAVGRAPSHVPGQRPCRGHGVSNNASCPHASRIRGTAVRAAAAPDLPGHFPRPV